jgi:hypothetical protein
MYIEINKVIYHFIFHVVTDFLMALSHPFVAKQCSCNFSALKCMLANESIGKKQSLFINRLSILTIIIEHYQASPETATILI